MDLPEDPVKIENGVIQEGPYKGVQAMRLNQLPGTFLYVHQFIHDHRRYTMAQTVRDTIDRELVPHPSTVHELCVERLPLVMLEIMKDPNIYVWNMGRASPHYHPDLERYTLNVYRILIKCYDFMNNSEDFDKNYRGLALKLLQQSPAIWPVLWENRGVLDPGIGRAILCDEDAEEDGFRGAIASVIGCVMQCSLRLFGQAPDAIPRLSLGMAELLIYCWQYHTTLQTRVPSLRSATVLIVNSQSPVEEYQKVLAQVITDQESASRVARVLCRDLYNRYLVDEFLSHHFEFLHTLVQGSPLFVRAGMPEDDPSRGTIRSIATACQRQLCLRSTSDEIWEIPNISQGLVTIKFLLQNYGPRMGVDGDLQLYDLESVEILCRIASRVLIPSVRLIAPLLYGAIITIYDIYASALATIDINVRGGKLMRFHQILQHCWFKAMVGLKQIRLQSWMEPYCVLEQWGNIGPKLGIQYTRFSQPPGDPDDVDTGDRLCHWSDCLCHKTVPYHPLRVCRGCWKVFYCSKLCQKRDWKKGGHRFKCVGRRERKSKTSKSKSTRGR